VLSYFYLKGCLKIEQFFMKFLKDDRCICLAKLSPFPYNIIYETIKDFIHNFFFIKWSSKKSKLIYPSFYNLQKKLVMPSDPCEVFFSWPFSFLMHP
jgi:hypothetical protein